MHQGDVALERTHGSMDLNSERYQTGRPKQTFSRCVKRRAFFLRRPNCLVKGCSSGWRPQTGVAEGL